jgi:hypothetical protein
MEILLLVVMLLLIVYAQELSVSKVLKIVNFKYTFSEKLQYQEWLKPIITIKTDKAYLLFGSTCMVKIDAFDNSIMEKK